MDIRVVVEDVTQFRGDAVVIGLLEAACERGEGARLRRGRRRHALGGPAAAADAALGGAIGRLIESGEITGKWASRR